MRAAGLLGLALLAGACAGAPDTTPAFDLVMLAPTAEDAEPSVTVGWLRLGEPMLLYSTEAAARAEDHPACVSLRPLSMAGVVSKEYDGRRMAVTGRVERDVKSPCASGLTIVANDISVP